MPSWRRIDKTWCSWPSKPIGLIEMIGGSYLSATPNISYKRLLDELSKRNLAVHAWSYVPSFDHQGQSNQAWKDLRKCRLELEQRLGNISLQPIRIGHSLGCKLHLIAPDGGRRIKCFIGISFNNFKADKSIPILGKVKRKLNIETEFSPSPIKTMNLIYKNYLQSNNLLIKFNNDRFDQTKLLFDILQKRNTGGSEMIKLNGNHLTPASAGIRELILGDDIEEKTIKNHNLRCLIDTIYKYALK